MWEESSHVTGPFSTLLCRSQVLYLSVTSPKTPDLEADVGFLGSQWEHIRDTKQTFVSGE